MVTSHHDLPLRLPTHADTPASTRGTSPCSFRDQDRFRTALSPRTAHRSSKSPRRRISHLLQACRSPVRPRSSPGRQRSLAKASPSAGDPHPAPTAGLWSMMISSSSSSHRSLARRAAGTTTNTPSRTTFFRSLNRARRDLKIGQLQPLLLALPGHPSLRSPSLRVPRPLRSLTPRLKGRRPSHHRLTPVTYPFLISTTTRSPRAPLSPRSDSLSLVRGCGLQVKASARSRVRVWDIGSFLMRLAWL